MAQRLDIVEEKFLNTIKKEKLIEKGDVIVVGVSGGPDSITLLTCLNKYKSKLGCKIICAHINHLIREDSTEDEQFVENVCKKMAIPFYAKRVKVEELAKINKKGTEETGRKVRYDFFNEICKKENANKIAIAHNQNDNAETMILNLVRGSGMQGLEGIQPSKYGKYIRPLIYVSRKEIEQYCEKNQLHPRIDSTNKENIYKRNIIRNIIMPELRKLNPNIEESLSRTSILAKENNEFVEQYAKKEYESIESKKNSNEVEIDLKKFNQENISIKQIIIRTAIEKLTGTTRNISKSYIDNIISMANNNIGGKHIEFNKIQVGVTKGKIIFTKKEQ